MKKYAIFASIIFLSVLLPVASVSADGDYYIAAQGESVDTIAKTYNLDGELVALMNDLPENEDLAEGELLRLPQTPYFSVTVSEGDTLYSLARTYGSSYEDIATANDLSRVDLIFPGQILLIPISEESSVVLGKTIEKTETRAVYASRSGFSYIWPVTGTISSPYGEREGGFHYGLDIAADEGTPIYAAQAGLVTEVDWKNDSYGYTVMIDHGNGCETLYAHACTLIAKVNELVEAGQLIAYVGNTGNSTGPHLHFEIRLNGTCVDPQLYLP
jgi:murein DD-endopeptidase MepM/ murein hydrolase activator NlpD